MRRSTLRILARSRRQTKKPRRSQCTTTKSQRNSMVFSLFSIIIFHNDPHAVYCPLGVWNNTRHTLRLNAHTPMTSSAHFHAIRLLPGDDLLSALEQFIAEKRIEAGWIAGMVGSLSQAALRFAAQQEASRLTDAFEMIALSGTLSLSGTHLHLSIADPQGRMTGGHVMAGCIVRTTCELIIGELPAMSFSRQPCPLSGYDELVITSLSSTTKDITP